MEYRFRAKAVDDGTWAYGGISYAECDGSAFIVVTGKDNLGYITMMRKVDPKTLGQLTGVTDTKKIRIYVGDIVRVRINNPSSDRLYTDDYLFVVVFNEDKCKFELVNLLDNKLRYDLDKSCSDYYKIEGNIYETKNEK